MSSTIYKICDAALWRDAVASGTFRGAGIDMRDGYIHFSTAGQVKETAARHFAGVADLLLVAVDVQRDHVLILAALEISCDIGGLAVIERLEGLERTVALKDDHRD